VYWELSVILFTAPLHQHLSKRYSLRWLRILVLMHSFRVPKVLWVKAQERLAWLTVIYIVQAPPPVPRFAAAASQVHSTPIIANLESDILKIGLTKTSTCSTFIWATLFSKFRLHQSYNFCLKRQESNYSPLLGQGAVTVSQLVHLHSMFVCFTLHSMRVSEIVILTVANIQPYLRIHVDNSRAWKEWSWGTRHRQQNHQHHI